MDTKKPLVFFCAVVFALALVATVSAAELANIEFVSVDGMNFNNDNPTVTAGDSVVITVEFDAIESDEEVTITAEFEGDKIDTQVVSGVFDVEDGNTYKKKLTLKVPFELQDERSNNDLTLNIEIDGKDHKTEASYTLTVQRPSYNPVIKSIGISNSVEAGERVPVEVVIRNVGYNDLDDVYVTVKIAELGIEESAYMGDIVALEDDGETCEFSEDDDTVLVECNDNEDDTDTVRGILYLRIPYDANAGSYNLEVEVSNDDTTETAVKSIAVGNDFTNNLIVSASSKKVAVGEEAEYTLLLVNPTDKLKVYRIVTDSSGSLSSSTDDAVVAVPAGTSKTVKVTAVADKEGEYTFTVNVFSGEELVDSAELTTVVEGKATSKRISTSNPVVVLTIILAIIFIVLLVVLIVLIGKKPEKSEEFGESYY